MDEQITLHAPWLIAVWPGIGQVAVSAGYYLMAKLGMHLLGEFKAAELFDVEGVAISGGLVQTSRLPCSRLFVRQDPAGKRDIVVFIGEAQPTLGKYAFCRRLIAVVRAWGIERVFTFAALATEMRPRDPSRVFGVAADPASLAELKQLELPILEEGNIGGLNGLLLGVVAECGMRGSCLLGEMPAVFAQLPFPKASLAVLEAFAAIAGLEIDLTELREQAEATESTLDELLAQIEKAISGQEGSEESPDLGQPKMSQLNPADERHIEQLFEQARENRSKAYELKRELDRLGVFKDYEDRFLDLFEKPR